MHLLVFPFVVAGLLAKLKMNKMKKKNSVLELSQNNSFLIDDIFFFSKIGHELDSREITNVEQENILQEEPVASKN